MASKVVRFYRVEIVDEHDQRSSVDASFWVTARQHLASQVPKDREHAHNGARFYGEAGVGHSPAVPYVRVGRIRERAEWPDTVDDEYTLEPLTLQKRNLFEGAFLVPFGTVGRVAIMGPIRGIVSVAAIERWLTASLGLVPDGKSVELVPEIDPKVLEKLNVAEGVSKVSVRIPFDAEFVPTGGGGTVQAAVEAAAAARNDQLDLELSLSFGGRKTTGMRSDLLATARSLLKAGGATRLDVSMILPDGDGFKLEHHNLVKDVVAKTATFHVHDDEPTEIDSILEAIQQTITGFQDL